MPDPLSKWDVRLKRGLKRNLPASAESGVALFAYDTKELFVGNGPGQPLSKVGEGSSATPATLPVTNVDMDSPSHYFYGGVNSSEWQINRYDKTSPVLCEKATRSNNPSLDNLSSAWADRLLLTYT